MCGGAGTRLWPLSRKTLPKQFVAIKGDKSLFDLTLERVSSIPGVQEAVCVSNSEYRFNVLDGLHAAGMDADIILEPVGRNTAPALACAALHILAQGSDPIMLCLPSDHSCQNYDAFAEAVELAAKGANLGLLMTLGVDATRPASCYGYIVPGRPVEDLPGIAQSPHMDQRR